MTYFDTLPIHPKWKTALLPVATTINTIGEYLTAQRTQGCTILPAPEHIWRAFTTDPDTITVLIVGQDPYPTPGHATGLAFSLNPEVRPLARSLVNIYTELHDDLGITPPTHGDLTAWTHQGVMLLNKVLTVEAGQAGSHRNIGWEIVTAQAITTLTQRKTTPLVAILWGKDAQKLRPQLEQSPHTQIIASAHPSPLSARRGFFGSRPFSKTNTYLTQTGFAPISWQL
ncbi:uracil-DNA glycosylase [Corynebacterium sp. HS2168-gen11]|uniref:uracil-DNA glycosylase n=1 Tax=Corynebacterium sp. HS2168-gen11 TaxID=2974027 RepID=UPI00216B671B|nr:uracil-DNA glycosylase [Corynebacterium sp. HS2168-gen11]MCS4534799.1 uracil-DNA glycosylase [Corynebacterium sp. HS2168-gen11]